MDIDNPEIADVEFSNMFGSNSKIEIKPLNPGTTTFTVTTNDGSTASCELTVSGKIAETVSDEMVLNAKILKNNYDYEIMKKDRNSPSVVFYNEFDDSYLNTVKAYHDITTIGDAMFSGKVDTQSFYEAVLVQMLMMCTP